MRTDIDMPHANYVTVYSYFQPIRVSSGKASTCFKKEFMPLIVRKEDEIIWGKKTGYKAEWLVLSSFLKIY